MGGSMTPRFVTWSTLSAVLLGGLLFACTEVYADPVTAPFSFGSSPSPPGADPGLDVTRLPPFACPLDAKRVSCADNAHCEYGTSPDPACNEMYACNDELLKKVRDGSCG